MAMVTGDKKLVTYENRQKRLWSKRGEPTKTIAKPGLMVKKVILCVWWDWKGIIHYELLPLGQSLNSNLYSTTDQTEADDRREADRIGQ